MKILTAILLCLLCPGCFAPPEPGKPLAFIHVTVIDGTGAKVQSDQTVLVAGDRIATVGQTSRVKVPADTQVVDATGKFMIPGLWDMHVHWYDPDRFSLFIANGVTGVRQMFGGSELLKFRDQIESGKLLGPRMVIAGPIVDGPEPTWPGSIKAGNAEEGRQAVIKIKKDGYDFVKVYDGLPRDAYLAIADEARRQGIDFAGHVPESMTAAEASEAGQKSIEHLTDVLYSCSNSEEELRRIMHRLNRGKNDLTGEEENAVKRREAYDAGRAQALFTRFKKNHTWQCPTLVVIRNIAHLGDGSLTNDARLKYMPRETLDSWNPKNDFRFNDAKAAQYDFFEKMSQRMMLVAGHMEQARVDILCGTDCGNPYCFPGFSVHDELALLVQAGLTPMEALQTATLNPARYFNKTQDLGTLQQGKLADFVLLEANPLLDIHNTTKINAVVKNGQFFDRTALNTLLKKADTTAK